jgi:hypothetical protein
MVYLGKDKDGKEMYANWFFAGAPKDAITWAHQAINNGVLGGTANFITNKLGPIASTIVGLKTNKDYAGKPISKPNDSAVEKNLHQAEFVAEKAVPFTVSSVAEMLVDGKQHSMMDYASALAGSQTIHVAPKKGAPSKEAGVLPGKRSRKGFSIR